jgi:hypothetical protein
MTYEIITPRTIAVARGIPLDDAFALLDIAEGENLYLVYHNCSETSVKTLAAYPSYDEEWECPECGSWCDKSEVDLEFAKKVTTDVHRKLMGKPDRPEPVESLAEFLFEQDASVSHLVNIGWSLSADSDLLTEVWEDVLSSVETTKQVFGIDTVISDLDSIGSTEEARDFFMDYGIDGFVAEVNVCSRTFNFEAGYESIHMGITYPSWVYGKTIDELETKIRSAVTAKIEWLRQKQLEKHKAANK